MYLGLSNTQTGSFELPSFWVLMDFQNKTKSDKHSIKPYTGKSLHKKTVSLNSSWHIQGATAGAVCLSKKENRFVADPAEQKKRHVR